MKCPRCQQESPPKAKFCLGCGTPLSDVIITGRSYADLQAEIDGLRRELGEALEQQTATSEILRAISAAPTDLQGVLDTVAASAARLCNSVDAQIFRIDGTMLRIAASYGQIPKTTSAEARPISRGSVNGRAVVDRQTIHVHDLAAESDTEFPVGKAYQKLFGHRTVVATPLLREGTPIGAITIRRMEVRPFSEKEITLLETFADQAVIAIENVRLFKELEARNRDLTEALEQQTATSEILRVISSSPTDTQPVFDAIAENAARLCSANDAQVLRVEEEVLRLVAAFGAPSMPSVRRLTRGHLVGRAVIDRKTIHVRDLAQALAEYPETTAARYDVQSAVAVPLLREGVALGVIRISRTEIRPFTDNQIALLKTFADQAVIAIENVRLFTELQERNRALTEAHAQIAEALDRQMATSEILRVISTSPTDLQPVFDAIVGNAVRLCGASHGGVYRFDGELVHSVAHDGFTPEQLDDWRKTWPRPATAPSVACQAIRTRSLVRIADIETAAESMNLTPETLANLRARRSRSILAVPMFRRDEVIGTISLAHREVGGFSDRDVELLKTFADQAVIAIENVRLFTELQEKNREVELKSHELEAASRHKSEFLANMSHELRTPLNAVIGFSEVLHERMFGDLNEKQGEYVTDIYASGTHLLSLINDILDLSKIEAGRMELELADFHLPEAIENALVFVRERALRHGVTLEQSIDPRLGEIQGDERKIKQVLLNLLSNAIKFTPEGGRVEVRAAVANNMAELSVIDTGVGIAPEDHEAVFEEFRQVGTAEKKAEGTGLGLALARKFIELHGGRIWVNSQVGAGSTFTFTLPVHRGE
jgi:signal transduction histidine kinase